MRTEPVSLEKESANSANTAPDKVTQLLEASSARLRRSSFNNVEKQSSPDASKDAR